METSSTQNSEFSGILSPTSVLFARGVIARLAIWPALRIAVDQNWGGPGGAEKRTWLASVIVDAFEEQDPSPDVFYIEETLLQVMADEYEAELEDGSAESVAKDVVKLWNEVKGGNGDMVMTFEGQADRLKGKKVQVEEGIGSDSEGESESDEVEGDDDMEDWEDEPPQLLDHSRENQSKEPEIDEDGFTLVKGKGRR